MLSPRWRKMLGDARAARGRLALLVGALAVSIAALTTMLSAYAVLGREVPANYLATNPADAQLIVDRLDESIALQARTRPGVADAEASATIRARAVTGDGNVRPALLYVVPALGSSRINMVRLTSGAWPTDGDSMVLERSAVGVAKAGVGQFLTVDLPNRERKTLRIVGTVHDPSLAPAWQEQAVYGYVTPDALTALGGDRDLHVLKLVLSRNGAAAGEIEAVARDVALWLRGAGRTVQEIRVPPPRTHPHQAQMMALLVMLLCFSVLGLVLGSVLGATIVGGLLAVQAREIAVMKSVGARSGQIMALYVTAVGLLALLAAGIGTALGLAAGRAWVEAIAQLLNLEIASHAVPAWALASNLAIGLLVPLLAAAVPVASACRRSVRDALDDGGISRVAAASSRQERVLASVRGLGSASTLGLRNALRRRGRLALTVLLVGAAGAVFITSGDLRIAWTTNIAASAAARHYDVEIGLQGRAPEATVAHALRSLPGVRQVESWPAAPVNVDPGDHIDLSRTYPDEGHGRLTLRAAPPATDLIGVKLVAGRWLQAADHDAIVINSAAQTIAFPHAAVGDEVDLLVHHRPRRLRIVGIAREVMTPGTVYATDDVLRGDDLPAGFTNAVRVSLADRSGAEATALAATAALEREGVAVRAVVTEKLIQAAQGGHIRILVYALGFIAVTMGLVGALGQASMLSSSVTERTREFGVMRALGARGADIRRVVAAEALVGAVLGVGLAVPASLPLAALVGRIVGRVAAQPLELRPALAPIVGWLAIAILGAMAAALYPSIRAARLTVRETLAGC